MGYTVNYQATKVSVLGDSATLNLVPARQGQAEGENSATEAPAITLTMPVEQFTRLFKNWMPEYLGDAPIQITLPDEGSAPAKRYLHPLKVKVERG